MKSVKRLLAEKYLPLFSILVLAIGCSEPVPDKTTKGDSAVSGKISIAVDKTMQPITEALEAVFEHTYPDAGLDFNYTSELEAVRQLSKDSVRMVVLGRPLNEKENTYFTEQQITVREQLIGSDAIVLAIHPSNPVKQLTVDQVLGIIRGQIQRWNQLKAGGLQSPVNLVFDNANSGTVSYLTQKASVTQLPSNSFATNTYDDVLDYVASHPAALGILGWSWMSDSDDPNSSKMLSKVDIIALSPEDTLQGKNYFKPFQIDLQNDFYPFKRNIYFIRREGGAGLATGFTVFTTSEIGQRILLKSGILPYRIPAREVEFNTRPLKVE
jgi:phosphate transport system substrate-binding protein